MENEGHEPAPVSTAKFLIGLGNSAPWPLHAVREKHSTSARAHVPTVCGTIATLARTRGEFVRGNEFVDRSTLCPECMWFVALEHGTTADKLDRCQPRGAKLAALQRCLPDPLLYVRVVEHLLVQAGENDTDHDVLAELLGHVTAHAPVLLVQEPCGEDQCDHDSDDECYGDEPTAVCMTCSVLNGSWAGEWEGQVFIPVPPCGVLAAVAGHYGVQAVTS